MLRLQVVFVIDCHFSERYNLLALLQKYLNVDVLGEGVQCVEVPLDFLVGPLLIKLFEVLPKALEGPALNHF